MLVIIGQEAQQESINNLHKDREELKQIDQEKYPLKKSFETEEPTSFGLWDFGVFILPKSRIFLPYMLILIYIILLVGSSIFATIGIFLDDDKFSEIINSLTLQPNKKEQQMFEKIKSFTDYDTYCKNRDEIRNYEHKIRHYENEKRQCKNEQIYCGNIKRKIEEDKYDYSQRFKESDERIKKYDEDIEKYDKKIKEFDERIKELDEEIKKSDEKIKEFNKISEDYNFLSYSLLNATYRIPDSKSELEEKIEKIKNFKFESKFYTENLKKTEDFDLEIVKKIIIKQVSSWTRRAMPIIFMIATAMVLHGMILAFATMYLSSLHGKLEKDILNYLYIYFFNNAHHLVRKSDYEIYEYITELSSDYSKITVEFFNFVFSIVALIMLIIFSIYLISNTNTVLSKDFVEKFTNNFEKFSKDELKEIESEFTKDQYKFLKENKMIILNFIKEVIEKDCGKEIDEIERKTEREIYEIERNTEWEINKIQEETEEKIHEIEQEIKEKTSEILKKITGKISETEKKACEKICEKGKEEITKIIKNSNIEKEKIVAKRKAVYKKKEDEISKVIKKNLEKELSTLSKRCKLISYIPLIVGIISFLLVNFLGVFFKYRSIQEKKANSQKQESYKGALMNGFKSSKLFLANDFTSYKNRVLTSIKNSDNSSNKVYSLLSGLIGFISFIISLTLANSSFPLQYKKLAGGRDTIYSTKENLLCLLMFLLILINNLSFSDYGSSYINIQSKIGIFKEIKEKQEQEKYYLEKAKNDETKYNYEKDDLIIDGVKTPFLNYPFTLVLKKGAHLSLTGPTGVGKSTFVDCLTRYSEIYDGKIIYNNKDIRSNPYWKSQLIFSPQKDALILTISFKENVAFGLPNIDEDIVNKALTLADIKHIVDKNGGLEALPPTSLSGGEQARLLMARVFYFILKYPKSVKIIILDESNSGMDQRTARKVFGNLFKIGEENGTIFISILHHEIEGDNNKGVLELSFTKDPVIRTTKGYDKVFSSIKQYNHSLKNINTLHNNNSDLDNIDNDIDNNDDNNDNDIDDDSSLDEDDNSSDQEDL